MNKKLEHRSRTLTDVLTVINGRHITLLRQLADQENAEATKTVAEIKQQTQKYTKQINVILGELPDKIDEYLSTKGLSTPKPKNTTKS